MQIFIINTEENEVFNLDYALCITHYALLYSPGDQVKFSAAEQFQKNKLLIVKCRNAGEILSFEEFE